MATEHDFDFEGESLLSYTRDIVAAHLAHNNVALADVPAFIRDVHSTLESLGAAPEPEEVAAVPIMDPRKAVRPDYLVCLECGKKHKTLVAHVRAYHGLEPDEYRNKYDLPASYPMTAKNYREAAKQRALAMGLGGKLTKWRKEHGDMKPKARPTLRVAGGKPAAKAANAS